MTGEQQYLSLAQRVLDEGVWVENERTGKKCLTIINADLEYDVGNKQFPILTTKQVFATSAIAEVIGYIRGYTNAQDFADIGSPSWKMNANKTPAWINNPNRKGVDDCGDIYGAVARDWHGIDLIDKVYNNLRSGIDDRREIVTFFDPSKFDKACLRPCAFQWQFSLLAGKLSLHVHQASCDVPLGLPWNAVSFYFLLDLMARITGNKPDKVYHKLVNVHVYEDQIVPLQEQLTREVVECSPVMIIPDWVECMDDVMYKDVHAKEYFTLTGYEHRGKITFPFSE